MQILAFSLFYFDETSLITTFQSVNILTVNTICIRWWYGGLKVLYMKNIKFSTFCVFALKIPNFRCFRIKIPSSKGMGHFSQFGGKKPCTGSNTFVWTKCLYCSWMSSGRWRYRRMRWPTHWRRTTMKPSRPWWRTSSARTNDWKKAPHSPCSWPRVIGAGESIYSYS